MGLHSLFESAVESDTALEAIENSIWQSLQVASSSSRHAWNRGVFCTASLDGESMTSINCRTVVLRAADSLKHTIDCHTDVRSQKIADLTGNATAAWTFYDSKSKIQLRACGKAAVIDDTDQQTENAWSATSLRSRSSYLSLHSPGQAVKSSKPPQTEERHVTFVESERGRANFRIVRFQIVALDWLYLRKSGHLRVQAEYEFGELVRLSWLVP